MFNKTSSRQHTPTTKELTLTITSDCLVTRPGNRKSPSENTKPSKLAFRTPISKQRIVVQTKSLTLAQNGNLKQVSKTKTTSESGTPLEQSKKKLVHKRSNSDGQALTDRGLCRTRSTSSLLNGPPKMTSSVNLVTEYETQCEQILESVESLVLKQYNVSKLSYRNVCWLMFDLGYTRFSNEHEFIENQADTDLGQLYKFWVNLTNSNSASFENFVLLLLHIHGLVSKCDKLQIRARDFATRIHQKQHSMKPQNNSYAEPEYRFLGIQSISSWTNTGRLVVHREQSLGLQKEFSQMVDYRTKQRLALSNNNTTPIKRFYTEGSDSNPTLNDISNRRTVFPDNKLNNMTMSAPPLSSTSNFQKKKVSCSYTVDTPSQPKRIKLKTRQQLQEQTLSTLSKTQALTSQRMKTEPYPAIPCLPLPKTARRVLAQKVATEQKKEQGKISRALRHRRVKSEQLCQQTIKPQPVRKVDSAETGKGLKKIPLLYVDINLDNTHKETIAIFQQDRSEQLAATFALKHSLDKEMEVKLKQLIDLQMNTVLTKIDEVYDEDDTLDK